jgi:hypothetical protein
MTPAYRTTGAAFRPFVRALQLPWSKPQQKNLLTFGTAFCEERRLPLRRLARGLAGPGQTLRAPEKRLRRFFGNPRLDLPGALAALLRFLLPRFGQVPYVPVMLDWTFVAKTHAVLWAQIPYQGRSFPLLCRVYPAPGANQTAAEVALLHELAAAWPVAAPRPLLLADRGFAKQEFLTALTAHGWFFLVRAKSSLVSYDRHGHRFYPESVPPGATTAVPHATALGQTAGSLHVVATTPPDWLPAAGRRANQRWLLVTNLPPEYLPLATRLYRHRMQPEQTHRDSKRGHFVSGFGLGHLRQMRPDRLERLVFCLGLLYAFLHLIAEAHPEGREWLEQRHWGLSRVTYALDLVASLGAQLRRSLLAALREGRWSPRWWVFSEEEPPRPANGER